MKGLAMANPTIEPRLLKPGIWELDGAIVLSDERLATMPTPLLDVHNPYSGPNTFDAASDWCLPIIAFAAEFQGEQMLAEAQGVVADHFGGI